MSKDKEIQDLLKPRYKVVSDWPGRRDFEVGQIVVLDKDFSQQFKKYEVEDCGGVRTYITLFFEMFPLQFKKLHWFQERPESEMPKYVKKSEAIEDDQIIYGYKVRQHFTQGGACCLVEGVGNIHYVYLEPATEEEYNSYISKLNQ